MTKQVKQKVRNDIDNAIDEVISKKLEQGAEIKKADVALTLQIPLCIGFKENISKDDFEALVNWLVFSENQNPKFSYNVYFYTNPKDTKAVESFFSLNAQAVKVLRDKNKGFMMDEWRKNNPNRDMAEKAYKAFRENQERNEASKKAIGTDAGKFLKRGNNAELFSEEEAIDIVVGEVIDYLSWFERKDNPNASQVSILLYPQKLFDEMGHVNRCADELGYMRGSLPRIGCDFERVRESTNDAVMNRSQNMAIPGQSADVGNMPFSPQGSPESSPSHLSQNLSPLSTQQMSQTLTPPLSPYASPNASAYSSANPSRTPTPPLSPNLAPNSTLPSIPAGVDGIFLKMAGVVPPDYFGEALAAFVTKLQDLNNSANNFQSSLSENAASISASPVNPYTNILPMPGLLSNKGSSTMWAKKTMVQVPTITQSDPAPAKPVRVGAGLGSSNDF